MLEADDDEEAVEAGQDAEPTVVLEVQVPSSVESSSCSTASAVVRSSANRSILS